MSRLTWSHRSPNQASDVLEGKTMQQHESGHRRLIPRIAPWPASSLLTGQATYNPEVVTAKGPTSSHALCPRDVDPGEVARVRSVVVRILRKPRNRKIDDAETTSRQQRAPRLSRSDWGAWE